LDGKERMQMGGVRLISVTKYWYTTVVSERYTTCTKSDDQMIRVDVDVELNVDMDVDVDVDVDEGRHFLCSADGDAHCIVMIAKERGPPFFLSASDCTVCTKGTVHVGHQ
jgi:hypothetical protein